MNRNHAPRIFNKYLNYWVPTFLFFSAVIHLNLYDNIDKSTFHGKVSWELNCSDKLGWAFITCPTILVHNGGFRVVHIETLIWCVLTFWFVCFCFLFVVGRLPKKAAAINFLQVPNSWIEMAVQLYKIITPKSGWLIIFHHPPNPWKDLANNQGIVGCTPCQRIPMRNPYTSPIYLLGVHAIVP